MAGPSFCSTRAPLRHYRVSKNTGTAMPELPEVETVRRGLAPFMEGARIDRLELRRADLRFPLPADFANRVEGRQVTGLGRRAKYLLIGLDGDLTIIAHLGMSGSFRIEDASEASIPGDFHMARSKLAAHDHVIFHLGGGPSATRIIYNDPRRFGFMDLTATSQLDSHASLAGLGPEPTGNDLSAGLLAARLKGRNTPVKSALLDQSVIAGLGNIYVCEALHRSGIAPSAKAASLVTDGGRPRQRLERLTDEIRQVIGEAIVAGGSSLRDHIQTDGSLGYFQHTFRVYDREGEPCRTAGCTGTIERFVQSGRSTFHCPVCQR